jgi:hypothetical protein
MRDLTLTTQRWLGPGGVLVTLDPPPAPYGYDFSLNVMHVDEDAVCPVCLCWIAPHDIVRRTAYGPAQHELCPLRRVPVAP